MQDEEGVPVALLELVLAAANAVEKLRKRSLALSVLRSS